MGEWIAVADRLPDTDLEVIAWGRLLTTIPGFESHPHMAMAIYHVELGKTMQGETHWQERESSGKTIRFVITHWQPLPEPPKE